MKSLDERLDSFAESWKPKPGDKLIGVVTDLNERDNEYGSYPIVTVRTDDGTELAFHAFHTVARNELAKQRPQIGDRIGIAYHGKPKGKTYEAYRIIVERDEQPKQLDWEEYVEDVVKQDLDEELADDEGTTVEPDKLPF
jgi:hypothetical protein